MSAKRLADWTSVLVLCAAGAYAAVLGWQSRPVWWWYEPGEVLVSDAVVGECPEIQFSREINRPFHARWRVTLRQVLPAGLTIVDVWRGENDYDPGTVLPERMDLGWWAWLDHCDLAPGTYDILTAWHVEPRLSGSRVVRVQSNRFRITESQ